jgi:hypothetical protein
MVENSGGTEKNGDEAESGQMSPDAHGGYPPIPVLDAY